MKTQRSPVTEVAVFGVGMGLIVGAGALLALTSLKSSPDLWGTRRGIAIGVPLAIISACHFFSGVALITTKAKWAVACSIITAFITTGFYFIFEISTIGFFQAKLVSVVAYGLPVLLIIRGRKALTYIGEITFREGVDGGRHGE
jgi:hypothetical protein